MAVAKENKVVHGNDLTYITQKYKEYFVAKEAGKGLSTNDYTTEEKTKLAGIESGAQVNDIEIIKVNGTARTPDANKAVDITVPTKLSDLTDDVVSGKYLPLSGGDMSSGASLRFKDAGSSMVIQPFGIIKESNETSHVISFPDKQGTVALTSDIAASLVSPAFTGTPTAPTASAGTNNTQVATTAFVTNAVTNAIGSVTGISFNTDYATYAALVAAGTAAQKAGVIYLIPNSGSSPNIKDEYVWTGSSYELLGTTEVDLSRFDEDLTATEIEQLLALNS